MTLKMDKNLAVAGARFSRHMNLTEVNPNTVIWRDTSGVVIVQQPLRSIDVKVRVKILRPSHYALQ